MTVARPVLGSKEKRRVECDERVRERKRESRRRDCVCLLFSSPMISLLTDAWVRFHAMNSQFHRYTRTSYTYVRVWYAKREEEQTQQIIISIIRHRRRRKKTEVIFRPTVGQRQDLIKTHTKWKAKHPENLSFNHRIITSNAWLTTEWRNSRIQS